MGMGMGMPKSTCLVPWVMLVILNRPDVDPVVLFFVFFCLKSSLLSPVMKDSDMLWGLIGPLHQILVQQTNFLQ